MGFSRFIRIATVTIGIINRVILVILIIYHITFVFVLVQQFIGTRFIQIVSRYFVKVAGIRSVVGILVRRITNIILLFYWSSERFVVPPN
jgi:hypothetical protein